MKVAFFLYPYDGHVIPLLELIHILAEQGDILYCYSSKKYRNLIIKSGGIFRELDFNIPDAGRIYEGDFQNISNYKSTLKNFNQYNHKIAERYLTEFACLNPDIVLADNMCLAGTFLAKRLNKVSILFHMDFIFTQKMRYQILMEKWQQSGIDIKQINRYWSIFKSMDIYLDDYYSPYLNFAFIPRIFQIRNNLLDPDLYKFVGYCPSIDYQKWYSCNYDMSCKYYVDLGEAYILEYTNFYIDIIHFFMNTSETVVINVRNEKTRKLLAEYENSYDNIKIVSNMHLNLLKNAEYCITNGELFTVREAIINMVIPILVPISFDHIMTATVIEKYNAGIYVKDFVNKRLLIDYILSEIRQDKMLKNVSFLKDVFLKFNTFKYISEIIHRNYGENEVYKYGKK